MEIFKEPFGKLSDGTEVFRWNLINENGLTAKVLDYGATVQSLIVPDKNKNPVDVVLGHDTIEEYVAGDCYLGATIGRVGNRIGEGKFELNGEEYKLFINNGPNHLHGGKKGFDRFVWDSKQEGDFVVFKRTSPDGEEGYPGNLEVSVKMGWKENSFTIEYSAETDKDTVLNLTNHSYFNLNGAGSGNIHNHVLEINAERFTVCDENCLPTGELAPVENTAMDFRKPKTIGKDIENDEPCVKLSRGYDSTFVISGHPFAKATGDLSGITLVADTDQPGVQLYTANFLTDSNGKGGLDCGVRSAFCLETQHFPDSIHHPEWPTVILKKGEKFESFTSYTFI